MSTWEVGSSVYTIVKEEEEENSGITIISELKELTFL